MEIKYLVLLFSCMQILKDREFQVVIDYGNVLPCYKTMFCYIKNKYKYKTIYD